MGDGKRYSGRDIIEEAQRHPCVFPSPAEHDIKMKVVLAQLIHVAGAIQNDAAVLNALVRASFVTIGPLCMTSRGERNEILKILERRISRRVSRCTTPPLYLPPRSLAVFKRFTFVLCAEIENEGGAEEEGDDPLLPMTAQNGPNACAANDECIRAILHESLLSRRLSESTILRGILDSPPINLLRVPLFSREIHAG